MLYDTHPSPVTDTLAPRLREALGPDYTLERELGGGGMSRVFVAMERALGRRVVVKVLPPDLAAGVNMERFRREIQLAAQLQHPHVVPLLTAGERDGLLWFTMPFIEGESLRATLDRRGRLSPREVLRILHDVVDALAYAHSRGVVHRDIKPGNILMSGSHAVVTDFGVAKALSAAIPIPGHTTSGMAIGTPAYMAPEQLAADPAADHRVDLYAVGLLAYELLTGTSPFSGSSPQATLAAQLTVRPIAPHITRPDVPAALSNTIMQCLEKDAGRRPATASALLEQLDLVSAEVSGEMAARPDSSGSRRGVLAALMLLLVASTVFAISRTRDTTTAASNGPRDSMVAAAPPETVVVYRDVPVPVGRDEAEGVRLPVVLSPAESIAIARQLGGRLTDTPGSAARPSTATIDRDSIVAEVARVFADSMARAMARMESALAALPRQQQLQTLVMQSVAAAGLDTARGARVRIEAAVPPRPPPRPTASRTPADSIRAGQSADRGPEPRFIPGDASSPVVPLIAPPPEGMRRLAILPFADRTHDSTLAALGAMLLDSIDGALRGSRGRLEIIPASAVRRMFGGTPGRATAVGFSLRAHYVLSGLYTVRNDSLLVVTVLTDVQGGSGTRAHEVAVPLAQRADAIAPTARWVRARLDSLRLEAARRSPGGPGGIGGPAPRPE